MDGWIGDIFILFGSYLSLVSKRNYKMLFIRYRENGGTKSREGEDEEEDTKAEPKVCARLERLNSKLR